MKKMFSINVDCFHLIRMFSFKCGFLQRDRVATVHENRRLLGIAKWWRYEMRMHGYVEMPIGGYFLMRIPGYINENTQPI